MKRDDLMATLRQDFPGFEARALWPRILFKLYVRRGNWNAILLMRLIEHFHRQNRPRHLRWATTMLRREFGSFMQPGARIGPALRLPHPQGIVVGGGVKIGARCTIYHQVTFGATRRGETVTDRYPQVGDDVTIFAGATLIGPIRIGDGAVIGANAVVLQDVPAGYRATGVPAACKPLTVR